MELEKVVQGLGEEIERIIDTEEDPKEVVKKTASALRKIYNEHGAKPIAAFLTGMIMDYSNPGYVPYYLFRSMTVNEVTEKFEKTINEDGKIPNFWENLASAILQHAFVVDKMKEGTLFAPKKEKEKEQFLSDVEDF